MSQHQKKHSIFVEFPLFTAFAPKCIVLCTNALQYRMYDLKVYVDFLFSTALKHGSQQEIHENSEKMSNFTFIAATELKLSGIIQYHKET